MWLNTYPRVSSEVFTKVDRGVEEGRHGREGEKVKTLGFSEVSAPTSSTRLNTQPGTYARTPCAEQIHSKPCTENGGDNSHQQTI